MAIAGTQRIDLGFAAALLLVAVTGVVAYSATHRMARLAQEVDRSHHVLTYTERVLSGIVDAETSQRGYVITGDTTYLRPYRAATRRIYGQLATLGELAATDPLLEARVATLTALTARRLALVDAVNQARLAAGFDSAAALVRSGRGREVMDTVRAVAATLQRAEQTRLAELASRSSRTGRFAQLTVALGLLTAFLIVVGGVIAVRHEFRVRRRAESALRENQTLLKQFMDTLPIGAFVVDSAGRSSFANTTALAMLGRESLPRHEGGDALQLWQSGSYEPVPHEENPLTLALRGLAAGADSFEIRVAGRTIPVEIFAAPVFDTEGRVAHAIAAISDVTERKRQQAALRTAKEAAEHASQAKSEFLARMSHELRTPLNSIIGFANILLKKPELGLAERERTFLERILENGKHLLLLINDILDLAKIEAGKIVVEKELVEVRPLVAEVLQQWEGQSLKGGAVRLEAEVPEPAAAIFTDRVRLRQVLINLVSNAVKFTERGSVRVVVETAPGSARPVRIRIIDTGIGIAPDRLDAIFDAFEQAETSTTRKYGGTGLGLPISRALCHLLGYELTVSSEPGAGTEFTIDLDARSPLPPPGAATGAAPPLVLVVDDDAESRSLLMEQIEALGCRTVAAFSAEQALHFAHALKPGLITLDLLLPDVTGWEVLARLKADPDLAAIPVLAIAAVGIDTDPVILGALDALEKPITTRRLQAVLDRSLHGARPQRVLIVEPDEEARALLERTLAAEAEEIRAAGDGAQALRLLQDGFRPDVILLDLLTPALDGLAFLDTIRADARTRDARIIAITSREPTPAEHARLRGGTAAVLRRSSGTLAQDLRRALRGLLPETG